MKIGIIGGGMVGGTLARRFIDAGHDVKVGVPNPTDEKYKDLPAVSPQQAGTHGEIVFLATPWSATEAAVTAVKNELNGKVVVDCTNAIKPDFAGLIFGVQDSAGQHVSGWLPGSKVVKAFNTIGFNIVADPQEATLLIAGDDDTAKGTVIELAMEIGFDPVDVGPLSLAAYTEAQAWLWITLAMKQGRDFTFNIVRR